MSDNNPKGYIPVMQKPACCVPTTLQMILTRHGFASYDQEDLGNLMGLTVPKSFSHYFTKVATTENPPEHGWGTRIDLPQYSLSSVFNKLSLPLEAGFVFSDQLQTVSHLKKELLAVSEDMNSDCMMCVQTGALQGRPDPVNGHVLLFAGADQDRVYYIDPAEPVKAVQSTSYNNLHQAMILRGPKNWGGLWKIRKNLM